MAQVTLKGNAVNTSGDLPAAGQPCPDFKLAANNLSDVSLADFKGKKKLISIVPSLDTDVCATSCDEFDKVAADFPDTAFLVVSVDTPFAQQRFCSEHSCKNITTLSMVRSKKFAKDFGVLIQDGPLTGVAARSVVVVDENDQVIYSELVPEITQEPNYTAALQALRT